MAHLSDMTWLIVQYRGWLIPLAAGIGGLVPFLNTARRHLPPPALSLVIRAGALALASSAAVVTFCSLLHFGDLRWLAPDKRGSLHLSAPGGLLGFTRPAVGVLNSVAGLPAEWRAVQAAVHTALVCAVLAAAAFVLAASTRHWARRAEIRQIVQEEMRRGNRS